MKRALRALAVCLSLALVLASVPPDAVVFAAETFSSGEGSENPGLNTPSEASPTQEAETFKTDALDLPAAEIEVENLDGFGSFEASDRDDGSSSETSPDPKPAGTPQSAPPTSEGAAQAAQGRLKTAVRAFLGPLSRSLERGKTQLARWTHSDSELNSYLSLFPFYDNELHHLMSRGDALPRDDLGSAGRRTRSLDPRLSLETPGNDSPGRRDEGSSDVFLPGAPPPPPPPTLTTNDEFGGPRYEKLSFWGKILLGLRWGVNIQAAKTIVVLGGNGLARAVPWQTQLSSGALERFGRFLFLVSKGPQQIAQSLALSPWSFLFLKVPTSAFLETIVFQVGYFGVTCYALRFLGYVSSGLSKGLEKQPDLFGLTSAAKRVLKIFPWISSHAFSIAAGFSAAVYAMAHVKAWGISPEMIAVQILAGLGLAYAGYKSRSILSTFVAHLAADVLGLLAGLFTLHFLAPAVAATYLWILSAASVGHAALTFRSYRKEASARQMKPMSGVRLGLALAVSMMLVTNSFFGPTSTQPASYKTIQKWGNVEARFLSEPTPSQRAITADRSSEREVVARLPAGFFDQKEPVPQQKAPRSSHKTGRLPLETRITEAAEPSVLMIVSKQANGYAIGSGSIVSQDGLALTNAHVVDPIPVGGTVNVQFSDGLVVDATVAGVNPDKDIALIQLPKSGAPYPVLPIGNSGDQHIAFKVLAMGHPLALPFNVTQGIISSAVKDEDGLEKSGTPYEDWRRTDAAVNHGNSGGPLVNMKGEVIGMNTAIASPTPEGGSIGIAFFIPSDVLKAALAQYQKTGTIASGGLGIVVDATSPTAPAKGVQIESIEPGSPAEKAGLKAGDVILAIDGQPLHKAGYNPLTLDDQQAAAAQKNIGELAGAIGRKRPGDKTVLAVQRGDRTILVEAVLGAKSN